MSFQFPFQMAKSEPSRDRRALQTSVSSVGKAYLSAAEPAWPGTELPVPGGGQADLGTQENLNPTLPSCWPQNQIQKSKELSVCLSSMQLPSPSLGLWNGAAWETELAL